MSLTWIEHRFGNGCTAEVGKVGRLIVEWDASRSKDDMRKLPPYKVRIFDHFMKNRFDDEEVAKKWAEDTARLWLSQALDEAEK